MCSDSIDVTARHALVHAMVADPDPDVLVGSGSVFFSEVGFGSGTVMHDIRSFTTLSKFQSKASLKPMNALVFFCICKYKSYSKINDEFITEKSFRNIL